MSDIARDYRSGLAAAMLDEGVVRLGHSDDGYGVTVECDTAVMGKPGSQLHDIAAFGYSMTLRESGLLQPNSMPGVVTFSPAQQFISRVMKEALGVDWQWADEQPTIEDVDLITPDLRPVVMLDTTLDESSVELAKAANRYGQLVGMVALLDMQKGARTALREEVGVDHIHSVITLGDILRYVLRANRGPVTQRECIVAMSQLEA